MNPDVFGPAPAGLKAKVTKWVLAHFALFSRVVRCVRPIVVIGGDYLVTRYDDVREVFLNDGRFTVPYAPNADIVVGCPPAPRFVLAMTDTPSYRAEIAAMRDVMVAEDLGWLAASARRSAAARLPAPGSRLEVVDFARQVIFDIFLDYFGVPDLPDGRLQLWVTRLFVFQLTYDGKDTALLADAKTMAPHLQGFIDTAIAARRVGHRLLPDDVIGRCLLRAWYGDGRYTDLAIRTIIVGCLIALPQVPMLIPNALEQLLRRPAQLAKARDAALAGDEDAVGRFLFEAARFDPLAPALHRIATCDAVLAEGSFRQRVIPKGSTVNASFASAMRDGRRIAQPERFDPDRPAADYMNFGYGLHRCFGEAINHAVLPAMVGVLLKRPIQRVPGPSGHLTKRSVFADTLTVTV